MKDTNTPVTDPAEPFSPRRALMDLVAMAMFGGFLLSGGLMLFTFDAVLGRQPWIGSIVVAFALMVCWRGDKAYKTLLGALPK